MNLEEWLSNDKLKRDIWNKKYRYNNESIEKWIDRVSQNNKDYKEIILKKQFLPGGRTLSNIGIEDNSSLFNCYSHGFVPDDYSEIMNVVKNVGLTYKYHGGQGISLSHIRPKGTAIGKRYTSDGIIPFMKIFNEVTECTSQGGSRKGALMISLDVWHKEAMNFITIKSKDGLIEKANLSLEIDNEFMQAVKEYYKNKRIIKVTRKQKYGSHEIEYEVTPIEVFKALVKNSYDYGDPACLFVDRFRNYNIMQFDKDYNIETCNPCVTGDTLISTTDGEIPIKELVGKQPYVYCRDDNGCLTIKKAIKVWKTRENAELVKVITKRGTLKCTPDHLVLTRNKGYVEASKLKHGDKLIGLNRCMNDEKHVSVGLSGSSYVPEHRFIMNNFFDIKGRDIHHKDNDTLNNTFENLEVLTHSTHSKITNEGHEDWCKHDRLTGRFLKNDNHKPKTTLNLNCGKGTNWYVDKVEILGEKEDVYDMTVEDVHNFIANRIVVHNCGEQPLPKHGACCLGSINLSEFIENPYTVKSVFNDKEFEKVVKLAVRYMDSLIDINYDRHPIKEQREMSFNYRNIGIGVMGYANALMKLGLTYGSDEALNFTENIFRNMFRIAVKESSLLAKEKGSFPKYSDVVWKSDIIENHFTEFELRTLKKQGLRNCSLLSIAPTGTLSNFLGISGGCEPEFALSYIRRTVGLTDNDEYYKVYCKSVEEFMKKYNIKDETELPSYFISSEKIPYINRILTQAVMQKHIDTAISSTINLPENSTEDDVADIFIKSWENGLKGITIFRSNCKRLAILTTDENKQAKQKKETSDNTLSRGELIHNDNIIGLKRTLMTGCGTLHCSAYFDKDSGEFVELFLGKGSQGGCLSTLNGLARLTSLSARAGVKLDDIIGQLLSANACPSYAVRSAKKKDTSKGTCCPSAIANALKEMSEEMKCMIHNVKYEKKEEIVSDEKCPTCGSVIYHSNGCVECKNCGWSKCG